MSETIEVRVPDIGDFEDVEVVELLVGPGDEVAIDDGLISIESEKATMEIPSPAAGVVQALHVSLGDHVSEGGLIVELAAEAAAPVSSTPDPDPAASSESSSTIEHSQAAEVLTDDEEPVPAESEEKPAPGDGPMRAPPVPHEGVPVTDDVHAGPGVRRFARELGVPLEQATGSGAHGRILEDDVKRFVRTALESGSTSSGSTASELPVVDPSQFGPTHVEPLNKVRRVSARNLTQSWQAPHVTQFDEVDLTELEAFRRSIAAESRDRGIKLSPLHFVMKAVSIALHEFPDMRSSLAPGGEELWVKDYIHLGIAADTEHGLVVPVVRDVDRKGLFVLAEELADLASRARARRLGPSDMQGAVFTISSLGGIGGTAFTPIVNRPEVGILGLSKLEVRPVWNAGLDLGSEGGAFEPRIILPLSLSYDHRVIDGAVAVRFTTRLVRLLSHPAHLLL